MTLSEIPVEKFIASLWDWAIVDGCFGNTRIKPTDLDGFVERNGRFLILEGKRGTTEVKRGQDILHRNAVASGLFWVVRLWGTPPNKVDRIQVLTPNGEWDYPEADNRKLRAVVNEWWKWADNV